MQRTNLQLRAVDLGRLAGVSAQQIRNYADAGILPPVPRSAAGYRRFGDAHRRALPRIGPILDGLRRAGSTDALHRAVEERNATLTAQARALLEAASHLHALVAGASK